MYQYFWDACTYAKQIIIFSWSNMRLLLTSKKLAGSSSYVDVSYRKRFFTTDFVKT